MIAKHRLARNWWFSCFSLQNPGIMGIRLDCRDQSVRQ